MKKTIAAVLAVLCLAGCSAKETPAQQPEQTEKPVVTAPAETVENPVDPTVEAPVQQFELEIENENEIQPEEALPEEPEEGQGKSVPVPVETVEGLVGDAVGYNFQKTRFQEYAASETINEFYAGLVEGLVEYANGPVNETCLTNNCIASVFGKVVRATLTGDRLEVLYECRVEYSGDTAGTVNVRTDTWNVQTGEVTSNVG